MNYVPVDAGTNSANFSGTKDAANQEVNKSIDKGTGPDWLFDINSLTKSINYVLVDAGINSTNFSSTKDVANPEVKKNVSSLRYILFPNWAHDALLESSSSKPHDESSSKVPEGKTPSLDNILSLTNRFKDILGVTTSSDEAIGVEADISNMETTISVSPTPTLQIHKDHPKSQIIGPVDTPIRTRHKSKEMEEQSFIATLYQKTDPALLQFCLFSCFLSQVEPKKAPRAWYGTLSKYLLKNGFQRGTIDQTLFIRSQREDFILVQVYVDDIIFGSSNL
nr:putative ribonuclease H-like domain-containing protein [Tanacetum cinerariifolium]